MSSVSTGPIAGVSTSTATARYGMKGTNAAGWLAQRGITVPTAPNRFTHWNEAGGGRCLRLGNSEFLIEYDASSAMPAQGSDGAWLLLRSDHSLLLDGPQWTDQLAQICSFDFRCFHDEPDLVVMTLLAGISVTLVREPQPANVTHLALRLWCDASYASYLHQCLQHLAHPDLSPGESR